mmetsp:Transcript_5606/g.14240  ORF Transcript_5606/g.14240 Transcript_5606/m.14240 type:complete len:285 (-) Transcript_5606:126-980(-)
MKQSKTFVGVLNWLLKVSLHMSRSSMPKERPRMPGWLDWLGKAFRHQDWSPKSSKPPQGPSPIAGVAATRRRSPSSSFHGVRVSYGQTLAGGKQGLPGRELCGLPFMYSQLTAGHGTGARKSKPPTGAPTTEGMGRPWTGWAKAYAAAGPPSKLTNFLFTKLTSKRSKVKPPTVWTTGSRHCCVGQSEAGIQPILETSRVVPVTQNFFNKASKILTSRVTRPSMSRPLVASTSEPAFDPKFTSISNVRILCWSSSEAISCSKTDHSEPCKFIFTCVDKGPRPLR